MEEKIIIPGAENAAPEKKKKIDDKKGEISQRVNYQNEEITFRLAEGGDWWFHAKGMPGSHVIVKCKGAELPDGTFEEAARLAAHYSKGKGQDKVEIDYIQKKHVKKPNGSKPGFVVYYTNYSMMIDTDISGIRQAES